jgi:formylglycine-generating enzyme required for sulfatase activity
VEEWRRAVEAGDADQAALHRLAVERLDLAPHAAELEGDGTLVIEPAQPAGEAWLFRYEREADVLPRGGPRWIPLPWSPSSPRETRPEVPAEHVALLARRLADEGSRPAAPDVPAPARATPDDAAHVGTADGPLRRARWMELCAASAYPLVRAQRGALGALSTERTLTLPPGRYLLLVVAPGCEPRRLPFELARRGAVRLAPGRLAPLGLPYGFVEVTPGPHVGPDGSPVGPFLAERFELTFEQWWEFLNDPRTLAEIALTRASGWRFVPRNADGPLSLPRPGDGRFEPMENPSRPVTHVSLFDLVGYPEPPEGESEPLDGQVAGAAEALAASRTVGWGYLAWRTERSRANARRALAGATGVADVVVARAEAPGGREAWALRFTLPTEEEWQRLASGGQTRAYPFGDEFDWGLTRAARSRRANASPEPVGVFPDDESPFGARDLAGSVAEWTASWSEKAKAFAVRGGSWASEDPALLRIDARRTERPGAAPATVGVRVIARETESVR